MTLSDESIDAVVCDPPYHLTSIVKRFGKADAAPAQTGATGAYKRHSTGFMGKQWDGGDIAFQPDTWAAVLRVLKPGAHMLCFGGTRTGHRVACAIEDAGFEIRDTICWHFGTGFPKNHDIGKALDKLAGAERDVVGRGISGATAIMGGLKGIEGERGHNLTNPATDEAKQWQGWGTALKPATEFIYLARKPLSESSIARNVLKHGTGAINVDGCRVEGAAEPTRFDPAKHISEGWRMNSTGKENAERAAQTTGRWPANIIHDGSDEVEAAFAAFGETKSVGGDGYKNSMFAGGKPTGGHGLGDTGSVSRYFYSAKASKDDRTGSKHPTVKPISLMRYLVRLITPPGGTVLDPFAGSGTTGAAAMREGFDAILIEREAEYIADIENRIARIKGEDGPLFTHIDVPPEKAKQEKLKL